MIMKPHAAELFLFVKGGNLAINIQAIRKQT